MSFTRVKCGSKNLLSSITTKVSFTRVQCGSKNLLSSITCPLAFKDYSSFYIHKRWKQILSENFKFKVLNMHLYVRLLVYTAKQSD